MIVTTPGIIAGGVVVPPPWTTVQAANCRLFWIASAASDSGPSAYTVSTMPDQVGGPSLTCTSVARAAGPATPVEMAAGNMTRICNASYRTAQGNGSWSVVVRGNPGVIPSNQLNIRVVDGTSGSGFFPRRDQVRVARTDSVSNWYWTFAHSSTNTRHTYGVSFSRGSPNSTASFYVDGVFVGAVADTTRDLTFGVTSEIMSGGGGSNESWAGNGQWSVALTGAEHLAVHNWFAAVEP